MSAESRLAIATDGFRSSESSGGGETTIIYTGESSSILAESLDSSLSTENLTNNSISLEMDDSIIISENSDDLSTVSSDETAYMSIG